MEKLEFPDKGVDNIILKHPMNDWRRRLAASRCTHDAMGSKTD